MKILSKHELHSIYVENTFEAEALLERLKRLGETEKFKEIEESVQKRKDNEPNWKNVQL